MLHGSVPGKDRRGLLERFHNDPDCRVFLSTDAGGTGLNLQVADTVINLEVPWNPAVLEQRIARVHRMGQHRPVQVINLVMRDSIEERVLRTLAQKRSLFGELFGGTSDEVVFSALGQQAFLEAVRELVAPPSPEPAAVPEVSPAPAEAQAVEGAEARPDPRLALLQASVQFLEALAAVLSAGANGSALVTTDARTGEPVLQIPLPAAQLAQRGSTALQTILRGLGAPAEPRT
jgi:hypothetical protein